MRDSRAAAIALFAFLGLLAVLKFPGPGPYGLDASYYTHLARNVARGDGYVSNVSLYNAGYVLPTRATMLPLWPLLLGYTGRVIGVIVAANVLPKLLFFTTLLTLWLLARAIVRRLGAREDIALLVVALFGLSSTFYSVTTHPYREGLAFTLAFASLIAADRFAATRSYRVLALSGLLAGLATLSRIQMSAVAVAMALVLTVAVIRERRLIASLFVYGFSAALPLIPWFLASGAIYTFYRWRPEPARVALPAFYPDDPPVTAAMMAKAVFVAFDVTSRYSFANVFGVAALAVPLAIIVWLVGLRGERPNFAFDRLVVYVTLLAGVINFAVLVPYQGEYLPYYFGWRQGLVLIFLLLVAVPWLLQHRVRAIQIIALALVVIACITSTRKTLRFIRQPNFQYLPAEQQLFAFLARHPRPPMLLTTNAQNLSMATDALIHSTSCTAMADVRRTYLQRLPIDYVLVYERETRCPWIGAIQREMRMVRMFGAEPQRVFVFARPRGAAAGPVLPSPPANR